MPNQQPDTRDPISVSNVERTTYYARRPNKQLIPILIQTNTTYILLQTEKILVLILIHSIYSRFGESNTITFPCSKSKEPLELPIPWRSLQMHPDSPF